jgi:molybdopterin/thiamine biosynthesis adenylyltransferase
MLKCNPEQSIAPEKLFSRNILAWGKEKQQRLADACILVAGVGGLGCTVSEILVRSGVGKLIILDNGIVDEPDLNRQILYTLDDLGRVKVDVAAEKLAAIHKQSTIIPINKRIEEDTRLFETLWQYEFQGIADCFDNFTSRFILEQLLKDNMFLVHGGVENNYGQITTIKKNATRMLKNLYPNVEDPVSPLPVCPQIVSCVASMMAYEVLNNLWETPQLMNTLLIVELSDFSFSKIQLSQ